MSVHREEWIVRADRWEPARANYHETIFTVGNGRLGTRGSLEEGHLGALSGTFIGGVFDAHDSPVIDLVNAPDWLWAEVSVDGETVDVDSLAVQHHQLALDLRTGVLHRATVFADGRGRRVRLATWRMASMADRDLAAQRLEITLLDADAATVTVTAGIDGRRRNLDRLPDYPEPPSLTPQTKWEKWARSSHLSEVSRGAVGDAVHLVSRTIGSDILVAYAAAVIPVTPAQGPCVVTRHEQIGQQLTFSCVRGESVVIEKLVGIATSRDPYENVDPLARAHTVVERHRDGGYDAVADASARVWETLWTSSDIQITGHPQDAKAVRFGIYHLLTAANSDDPTISIGAKSLSGEGYRGHVFWDSEIMMLPFYLHTQPATARALLGYRYHTLAGARDLSAEYGTAGARYAWESADTGREECPRWTPDGRNRFWTREEEVHVSADVAYGVLRYTEVTGDDEYLLQEGLEILIETSRFWASRLEDRADGTLGMSQVMGPDEFHTHVTDNAFTNDIVRWQLEQTVAMANRIRGSRPSAYAAIAERLALTDHELEGWAAVAARVRPPRTTSDGVIEQFDGYFNLEDLPISEWDDNNMPRYPPGRHHFNLEETRLLKQPDAVMAMFLLPDRYPLAVQLANFAYYERRTLHKSSLSPPIHAIVGLRVDDAARAVQYFKRSAYVDLDDNQGNTDEGVHIAAAGGTWQVVVFGFGGLQIESGQLTVTPSLPALWRGLRYSVCWRGHHLIVEITHDECAVTLLAPEGHTETVTVAGQGLTLRAGQRCVVPLRVRPCAAPPPSPQRADA